MKVQLEASRIRQRPNLIIVISIRSSHQRCSVKKEFLEISQNSQENTCARVSFLIKLQSCNWLLLQDVSRNNTNTWRRIIYVIIAFFPILKYDKQVDKLMISKNKLSYGNSVEKSEHLIFSPIFCSLNFFSIAFIVQC